MSAIDDYLRAEDRRRERQNLLLDAVAVVLVLGIMGLGLLAIVATTNGWW